MNLGRAFVSVRGYVKEPCLLEVDLSNDELIRTIEVPCDLPHSVPSEKRGFTGLQLCDGALYAATWDRVCIVDPETGKVLDSITDRRFTDLHSLHIDQDGVVWVTSTNLDGIYTVVDRRVEPFWHSWESDPSRSAQFDEAGDYRGLTKLDTPFHKYHVNAVHASGRRVLVTFQGRIPKINRLQHAASKLGIRTFPYRNGGIFVLDRDSRRLIRTIRMEGLHDLVPGGDGKLYSTQYFGESLIQLDPDRLLFRRIPLEIGPWQQSGYLTRGVLRQGNGFWVGHTRHRGWMQKDPTARMRFYALNGKWTGREVVLPGFSGVYDIISSAGIDPNAIIRKEVSESAVKAGK